MCLSVYNTSIIVLCKYNTQKINLWRKKLITAMGDVMREAYNRGWITTRDGNCSLRRSKSNILYITPSGVRKNIIYPETIERIKILKRSTSARNPSHFTEVLDLENIKNPSGELQMHWLLQRNWKRTRSVVHLHPTYIVAAMHAGLDLKEISKDFPEIYRYTRVGSNVPQVPPISEELATLTSECFDCSINGTISYDVVGQKGHGVCSIGRNPWDAFEHIERLEHICKIVLASR